MAASGTVPPGDRANVLYRQSDYAAALGILLPLPEKDGAHYFLIGQCYYSLGNARSASTYLEKAVASAPGNPRYHHWLGRAYGRRAESSSILTAPIWAVKARKSFEKVAQLDPNDIEAMSDLFEYYLEAPAFLGGGLDKAAALAERVRSLDAAEHQFHLARLAEKRKQFESAERHFREAGELAPLDVGRLIDLAQFLERRGRLLESDAVFNRAHEIAPEAPNLLFEQARTYVESGRNLETAGSLLKRYLNSRLAPDNPPRHEADRLLRRLPSGRY